MTTEHPEPNEKPIPPPKVPINPDTGEPAPENIYSVGTFAGATAAAGRLVVNHGPRYVTVFNGYQDVEGLTIEMTNGSITTAGIVWLGSGDFRCFPTKYIAAISRSGTANTSCIYMYSDLPVTGGSRARSATYNGTGASPQTGVWTVSMVATAATITIAGNPWMTTAVVGQVYVWIGPVTANNTYALVGATYIEGWVSAS